MNLDAKPVALRIDFVSDVVCPWCAIGLASLEQALERVRDEVRAELRFHPFELNPQMGPGGEDAAEHLVAKYGMTHDQLAENQARIRQRGAEVGFVFAEGRRRVVNTFDAHRLLHWAGLQGDGPEGRQRELKRALLRAYFSDGQDVSDHTTLVRVAAAAGLDAARAHEILASDEYATEVRAEEDLFQRAGIRGVPAIIIERKHLISGGQPAAVFERALREIAARN
jgi:predicted DsbA family dithiol-disulfide isomerase